MLVSVPSRHIVEGGLFADPSTDGTTVSVSIELEPAAGRPANEAAAGAAGWRPAPPGGQALPASATRVLLRLVDRASGELAAEAETTIAGTAETAVLIMTPKSALRRWGR